MSINVIGKTILKSLFSKPATAMYPAIPNEFYPRTRGAIENDVQLCTFCTLCAKRCPAGALEVDRKAKKWEIDRTRCIMCNYCVHVCPRKSLSAQRHYTLPMTDKEDRFVTLYGEIEEKEIEKAEKVEKVEKTEEDA
ncbi:MAG: 4Fe-4S dicluster domain-containing protein [Desulfitobacteriia bacterium]